MLPKLDGIADAKRLIEGLPATRFTGISMWNSPNRAKMICRAGETFCPTPAR
jgi:hypothetical protein